MYPQLEFAPAHGAEKGLSEAGQTIVLPLLVAREFHAFTFVFNGELEKPLHDPSRELASGFGFAFGRSFTRKVAAMIELRTESSIDFQRDRLVLVNAGSVVRLLPSGVDVEILVDNAPLIGRRFATSEEALEFSAEQQRKWVGDTAEL